MRVELGIEEAVRLATAVRPLPPVVADVRGNGDVLEADLDLRELPGLTGALRLATSLAGTARLVARLESYTDGVATLALDVAVRGLPVDKVVGILSGRLTQVLEDQGLPPGAVVLGQGPAGLTAVVQVQRVLDQHVSGIRLTGLTLAGGRVRAELEVGGVSLVAPPVTR